MATHISANQLAGTGERVMTALAAGDVSTATKKVNMYLADIGAITKTMAQLNADYPTAEVGQCVLCDTFKYEKTGPTQWISYAITKMS